jgi:hypothetical protein
MIGSLKNLSFPIIGLIFRGNLEYDIETRLESIQVVFKEQGFNAALFSPVLDRSIERNIFRLDEGKLVLDLIKYTKVILPDLILLHLHDHTLDTMEDVSFIDYIIKCNAESDTKNVEAHAESIYHKVMELFH